MKTCPDARAARSLQLPRRRFLGLSAGAAACGLGGGLTLSLPALADALTAEQREKLSPDEILDIMRKGNARFARGERKNRDYLREQRASAGGAASGRGFLSCIDSRAPAEVDHGSRDRRRLQCSTSPGTSSTRTSPEASSSTDIAGSIIRHQARGREGDPGHGTHGMRSDQGAIDGAQLGNLTGLLAKIRPAVNAATYSGVRTSKDSEVRRRGGPDECRADDEAAPRDQPGDHRAGRGQEGPHRRRDVRSRHGRRSTSSPEPGREGQGLPWFEGRGPCSPPPRIRHTGAAFHRSWKSVPFNHLPSGRGSGYIPPPTRGSRGGREDEEQSCGSCPCWRCSAPGW